MGLHLYFQKGMILMTEENLITLCIAFIKKTKDHSRETCSFNNVTLFSKTHGLPFMQGMDIYSKALQKMRTELSGKEQI